MLERAEALRCMFALDDCRNGSGAPISSQSRALIFKCLDDPNVGSWIRARGIIVVSPSLSLGRAVQGFTGSPQRPAPEVILQALEYVLRNDRKRFV